MGLEVTNDLYAFDIASMTWVHKDCQGTAPLGRTGHTMTAVEPTRSLVVFGGLNHDKGYLDDVHALDADTLTWSGIVNVCKKGPCGRDKHSAVAFGDSVVVFGGFGMVPAPKSEEEAESVQGNGALFFGWHNDVHVLCTAEQEEPAANGVTGRMMSWSQPETTGASPSSRAAHSACTMDDTMWIFGGRDVKGRLNDLHALDMKNWRWSTVNTLSAPSKRSFHCSGVVEVAGATHLLVFGGVDVNGRHCNSVFSLRLDDIVAGETQWTQVDTEKEGSGRGNCGHGVVAGKKLVVLGGSSDWDQEINLCRTFHATSFVLEVQ